MPMIGAMVQVEELKGGWCVVIFATVQFCFLEMYLFLHR